MEMRSSWDHAVPVDFLKEQAERWAQTKVLSRWSRALPHIIFTFRATLGCLATGALIWIPGVDTFLTPQARFFAVIVPPLAVSKHFGGVIRTLLVGLALICGATFFAAAVTASISASNIGIHFVVLGLGVFAFEWGGAPFGTLGKKLASGLYATVILNSARTSATQLSVMDSAISLIVGLAFGYLGALIGALIPPHLACTHVEKRIRRISRSFARLVGLLLSERGVDRQSPCLEELVAAEFTEIEKCQGKLLALIDDCHAETCWRSYESVREWHAFFAAIRYSTKGLWLALRKQDSHLEKEEEITFRHYSLFREELSDAEHEVALEMQSFFQNLMKDGNIASTEMLFNAFEGLKVKVLGSRKTFIDIENRQLARGVEHWPIHLQYDFFISYAALSSVARIREEICSFQQPPLHRKSFGPLLNTLYSLVYGWAPSAPLQANFPRLINCCVVTISVLLGSIFVFVPSGSALFPSGASAAVTAIFIHSSSGFGSSLKNSRDRLVGVIIGGLYAYFATLAFGSVPAITAAMTGWVAFSVFFLGQDALYTAQSSIFVVALALYASGVDPANAFTVVSNYLIANCLSAAILISIGSLFWALSVLTSRPGLLHSMEDYLNMISSSLDISVKRFSGELVPEFPIARLEKLLTLIVTLQSESDSEPLLFASPIPQSSQLVQVFSSLLVLARGLDDSSLAASEHLSELREFNVLDMETLAALSDLHAGVRSQLHACIDMLQAVSHPDRPLAPGWGSARHKAAKRFQLAVVKGLKRTSTKTALLGSRPIVRFVSAAFALTEFARNTDELFDSVSQLAALLRNQQKKYTQ